MNLHGHRWILEVEVAGSVGKDGMVHDFSELKRLVTEKVVSRLDHTLLNDLLEMPTAENIVVWVWKQLEGLPRGLVRLRLFETPDSFVELRLCEVSG